MVYLRALLTVGPANFVDTSSFQPRCQQEIIPRSTAGIDGNESLDGGEKEAHPFMNKSEEVLAPLDRFVVGPAGRKNSACS